MHRNGSLLVSQGLFSLSVGHVTLLGQFMLADTARSAADSLPQMCLKCCLPSSHLDHHFPYDISASSFY